MLLCCVLTVFVETVAHVSVKNHRGWTELPVRLHITWYMFVTVLEKTMNLAQEMQVLTGKKTVDNVSVNILFFLVHLKKKKWLARHCQV